MNQKDKDRIKDFDKKWKAKIRAREWRLANKEQGKKHASYRKEYLIDKEKEDEMSIL